MGVLQSADAITRGLLRTRGSSRLRGWRARPEIRLLQTRQRIRLGILALARVFVGACDLLLAAAMYFLFLLLQGGTPTHIHRWMPMSALAAAMETAALVVVRAASDLISTRMVVAEVEDLATDFLLRLTRGYNELQWTCYVQRNRSELLRHAMSTVREASNFYHLLIEIVSSVVIVALMAGALIYQNPLAAGGTMAVAALFYSVHRFVFRSRLQRAVVEREESSRLLQRTLADMFASGREIRSHRTHDIFHDRIRDLARPLSEGFRRIAFLPQFARVFAEQGVILTFLGVIIAVQVSHGDSRQLLSLLVFYFVLCRRLLPMISQMSFLAGQMEAAYKSVLLHCEELDDCAANRSLIGSAPLPGQESILTVEDASLRFGDGPMLLNGINFQMRKAEIVVMCGVSGVGKSSFLNLIAGLVSSTGVVSVDRARLSYIPQEIVLLDDSLRNNLLFGLPGATNEKIANALLAVDLTGFVATQAHGLDTRVGDNGVLLSGGQRQRVGLARSILRDPTLLLLDEATSALDEASEARILEKIRELNVAVLLVTHRMNHAVHRYRRVRLEGGVLTEERFGCFQSSAEEERVAV